MDIATRRAICLEILRGNEEAAFRQHRVSELDQAVLRRCAQEIVDTVVRRRAPFRHYWRAPIRNPIWPGFIVSAAFALVSLSYAIRLFPLVDYAIPATYPIATATAALFAIAAATSGWAFTSIVTARNARVNHSLTIVSDRFSKSDFGANTAKFNVAFKGKRINKALVEEMDESDSDVDKDGVQALRYLLNYFEYVSVGVILGELDETIIRKTLRGNLVHYYDRCASYIKEVQSENPRVLEHLTMLRTHFRDP
ncbi:DUF4760 domain-containing protein [Allosphingosinicella sp.]|uniref:DUF4760 domain-containing protein n=1 Tax=Allosphingosinicella sp. TaxID=2823234 RepID=UPI002F18DAC6